MANLYLTREYTGEEAFNILKGNLKNPKVINMVNNMNSFDVFTDWGKFNFAVQGNRVKVTQGWNKLNFFTYLFFAYRFKTCITPRAALLGL